MATEDMKPEPMTREEAKRILRRLELDAYSAVVTAFRAQGDMNKSKKSILGELSSQLSISTERHRAEVRRVVNDDRLNDVAECMHGPGTSTEWSIEGCRLVSLMPRLVPQTVFTAKATAAANQAVENNQKLPIKSEIEVLPLPTKTKGLPPKPTISDTKDDKTKQSASDAVNSAKLEDKLKKRKKPNILYTKPSPLALNKTLTNPFKPSSTPSSLKSIIKNPPLKYTATSGQPNKSSSTLLVSSPSTAFSPKPIILQRSPTKTVSTSSTNRAATISLQSSIAASSGLNSPLTSLNNLSSSSKSNDNSTLVQPMIKVVSNPQNIPATAIGATTASGSITQKIKFKTPLPKPKVKATKFKPLVPLQRPSILSSQNYGDSLMIGSSTATVTVTSTSPNKSVTSQGMSVKVVQVTKSPSLSASTSLMNSLNKPVVVVSNSAVLKTPQKLSFSGVPSSVTQQLKVISSSTTSTSITQSLPKGTLTSKSMPLATGFKMIAVTTVVPGTTQVKTVYIATPIMSLPKTVSQSSGASITTAAPQNIRHISSSLASNLQSVVARSINASSSSKLGNPSPSSTTISAAVTSITVAKTNKLTAQPKGLGTYKTTLAGTAQSLKLFTAVSKSRSTLNTTNVTKSTPLLPSTSLLTSVVSQQSAQRLGTLTSKLIDATSVRPRTDKIDSTTVSNSTFLNISAVGLNSVPQISNGVVPANGTVQDTIAVNSNSLEEVSATLNMLNDENTLTTEQITATGTGDTDDMAFLNAGEKFLEQLSAKMTATSPDSLSKTDAFLFPSNLMMDISDTNQTVFELPKDVGEYEISGGNPASTVSFDKNIIVQNGSAKQPALLAKDNCYFLSQKTTQNAPKILNNILPPGAKVLQSTSSSLSIGSFSQSSIGQSPVMANPVFQPKNEVNNRAILNYTNITNVSGKNDKDSNNVGFITVGANPSASGIVIGGNITPKTNLNSMKLSSSSQQTTANKLPMSIPGSSKLNISPILVNNMSNSMSAGDNNLKVTTNSLDKTQDTGTPNSLNKFFMTQNHSNETTNFMDESHKLNNIDLQDSPQSSLEINSNNKALTRDQKKRKLNNISPTPTPRTQVWMRSAANLLARVSRFRGANKQRGDMNAASWFTKPVDPLEAPGYYGIIKTPMDFGKIKKKLEEGEYETCSQFYDDMALVKKNCYAYNPANHVARKDCDDVFNFFEGEYKQLLEKWEKHHVSPQKRQRLAEENGNP